MCGAAVSAFPAVSILLLPVFPKPLFAALAGSKSSRVAPSSRKASDLSQSMHDSEGSSGGGGQGELRDQDTEGLAVIGSVEDLMKSRMLRAASTERGGCVVRPGRGFSCWDCFLHIVVVPSFPREGVSYAVFVWPFLQ